MHINLDDFLDTGSGRIWTVERNAEAWKRSFAAFAIALEQATQKTTVYVLVGAQASGKSLNQWITELLQREVAADA